MRCLLLISILTLSCSSKKEPEVSFSAKENFEQTISLDNPAIYMGSTFLEFFQMLSKTGQYIEMCRFSSTITINKFGKEKLLDFYSRMQFSYPLSLRTITKKGNTYSLLYKTETLATERTLQAFVVIENDSCKIVFDSLNKEKPFVGL